MDFPDNVVHEGVELSKNSAEIAEKREYIQMTKELLTEMGKCFSSYIDPTTAWICPGWLCKLR